MASIFQGNGYLIGVKSLKCKDGKERVFYSVLMGEVDQTTKLFKDPDLKLCIEEKIKINNPRYMQPVKFTMVLSQYNGNAIIRISDIQPA